MALESKNTPEINLDKENNRQDVQVVRKSISTGYVSKLKKVLKEKVDVDTLLKIAIRKIKI